MSLAVSSQIAGVVALNLIALVLLLAVEIKLRRRGALDPGSEARLPPQPSTAAPPSGLDRWIDEIEEVERVERRQAFADGGDFLPPQDGAVNG